MADHPGPWRLVPSPLGNHELQDANGNNVLDFLDMNGDVYVPDNPATVELVRAAPEMEALLRDLEERWPTSDPQPCIICHVPFADRFAPHPNEPRLVPHAPDCKLANLLTRIDEARRG